MKLYLKQSLFFPLTVCKRNNVNKVLGYMTGGGGGGVEIGLAPRTALRADRAGEGTEGMALLKATWLAGGRLAWAIWARRPSDVEASCPFWTFREGTCQLADLWPTSSS